MRISPQSEAPPPTLPAIDYLVIGHLSEDRTPDGISLGGTVSYAGLTAHSLGHAVGVVTAAAESTDLEPLDNISLIVKSSPHSTCFQNTYTREGRTQVVFSQAVGLSLEDVPREWWDTELIHIGPLMRELTSDIMEPFQASFVGITPQGLMRESDSEGNISALPWETAADFIENSDAVVLGIEDLDMNEEATSAVAEICSNVAITYGAQGARVWADEQWRSFPARPADEFDATGAGDIFAATFFSRLHDSGDPWIAAKTAVRLASTSVTRYGLSGAPTASEAEAALKQEDS
ncbi:MAG: PfkB family carbohydrate kinase [Anaerolineales bacterium]